MSSSISTLTSTYAAPLIGRLSNRQFGQAVVEFLDYFTDCEGAEGSDNSA